MGHTRHRDLFGVSEARYGVRVWTSGETRELVDERVGLRTFPVNTVLLSGSLSGNGQEIREIMSKKGYPPRSPIPDLEDNA